MAWGSGPRSGRRAGRHRQTRRSGQSLRFLPPHQAICSTLGDSLVTLATRTTAPAARCPERCFTCHSGRCGGLGRSRHRRGTRAAGCSGTGRTRRCGSRSRTTPAQVPPRVMLAPWAQEPQVPRARNHRAVNTVRRLPRHARTGTHARRSRSRHRPAPVPVCHRNRVAIRGDGGGRSDPPASASLGPRRTISA